MTFGKFALVFVFAVVFAVFAKDEHDFRQAATAAHASAGTSHALESCLLNSELHEEADCYRK